MPHSTSVPSTSALRVIAVPAIGLLAAAALAIGAVLQASGSVADPAAAHLGGERSADDRGIEAGFLDAVRSAGGTVGETDGVLPEGASVFDDSLPGIAQLQPELLDALRASATDASAAGIEFVVNSGRRSRAYQDRLLSDAVATYGSEEDAAKWVATAETSAHVSGEAVDIGGADAAAWLSGYGAAYGLCQIYGNEPWHFELRPEAVLEGCPVMFADPTEDPRMMR